MTTPCLVLEIESAPVPVAEIPGFIFTTDALIQAEYEAVIERVALDIFFRP